MRVVRHRRILRRRIVNIRHRLANVDNDHGDYSLPPPLRAVGGGFTFSRRREVSRWLRVQDRVLRSLAVEGNASDDEEMRRTRRNGSWQERYAKGAEMLADGSSRIRIAGLKVIGQLAGEVGAANYPWRQMCVNLICSYLRSTPVNFAVTEEACGLLPTLLNSDSESKEDGTKASAGSSICDLDLDLRGATLTSLDMRGRHIGEATFTDSQFTGHAIFGEARFAGPARFDWTHFKWNALFEGSRFAGPARFDWARFTGNAGFEGAQFTDKVRFGGAQVFGNARFGRALFTGSARFEGMHFAGPACFEGAKFTGNAWFQGSEFTESAQFEGTQFAGPVRFEGTQFAGPVQFEGTQFAVSVRFEGAHFAVPPTGLRQFPDQPASGSEGEIRRTATGAA